VTLKLKSPKTKKTAWYDQKPKLKTFKTKKKRNKMTTTDKPEKTAPPPPATKPAAAPPPVIMPFAQAVNPITGTPTFRTIILPVETRNTTSFNRKIYMTWQDVRLYTSATVQALIPENALGASTRMMLANTRVARWIANVVTPFTSSGGVITTLTFSLGDGGSATRFINAINLLVAGMTLGITADYLYTVADTIDATITVVGQTMASLNAGVLELYYDEVDINPMTQVLQP
jgi:hypothetical protein